jgi:hypothetical protein
MLDQPPRKPKFNELWIYQLALGMVGMASLVGGNVTIAVSSFTLVAFLAVVRPKRNRSSAPGTPCGHSAKLIMPAAARAGIA